MKLGRFASFLGFFCGLAASSAVLFAIVPRERPELDEVLAKRATCQVLIVGPSYINTGIREKTFDEEARRSGLNLKSCKYAEVGLRAYEVKHALSLLLRERWPKLEHVLVDITLGDKIGFRQENWFKSRVVDWHTFGALTWLYSRYERQPGSFGRHLSTLAVHAEHLLLNYLGIGRGIAALTRIRLPERTAATAKTRKESAPRAERPPGNYEQKLRRATAAKALARSSGRMTPNTWALELGAHAKSLGQKDIIFLISPVLETIPPVQGSSERAGRLVVFDFQDPARYPEVYRERARAHTSHLSTEGQAVYSKLLVQRLLELRKSR